MEDKRTCSSCGKELPASSPMGLCPECLLRSGFPTGTDPGQPRPPRFEPPPVAELASRFPHLEILALIGQGGMGAVYKARQPTLDRFVALKILPPASAEDPGYVERFSREARALARLNHPNIVAVYDFGQAGGQPYLVMEFVDGLNLRQVQAAGRISPEKALKIVPQICDALEIAHAEGIVHRDIKPENILLDLKGRVKITDFGIAKIVGLAEGKISLTGAKDSMGTPHYMAPEQVEHPKTVDHRADIYSLGVVFYELLTGELPLGKFQPPSRKVEVDVRLDEVVLHSLEKEPERRYQHASQVKTDLQSITTGGSARIAQEAASHPPSPREQWLERRRTFMLWYGVIACAVALPISFGLHLPWITVVSLASLIIGGYKLGWWTAIARGQQGAALPRPSADEPRHRGPMWPFTAALTCVLSFCLLLAGILAARVFRVGPDAGPVIYLLAILLVPLIGFISSRLMAGWLPVTQGSTAVPGAAILRAIGSVGGLLSVLCLGFTAFFLVAISSERGGWHPGTEEALFVPLCFAGAIVLPASTWLLFRAAAGRTNDPHIRAGALIIAALVALAVLGISLFIGQGNPRSRIVVTGTVMDSVTLEPVVHARVDDSIYGGRPGRPVSYTWTDARGEFKLATYSEEHDIVISAPGYQTAVHTLQSSFLGRPENPIVNIRLKPGKAVPALDEVTVSGRGATIKGRNTESSRIMLSIGSADNAVGCGFLSAGSFKATISLIAGGLSYVVQDDMKHILLTTRIKRLGSVSVADGTIVLFPGDLAIQDNTALIGEFQTGKSAAMPIRITLKD